MNIARIKRSALLASMTVVAIALTVVSPLAGVVQAAASSTRQSYFAAAAAEFHVPEEVLLGISYNQSRWENHKGKASVAGGYGLMHLTTEAVVEDGRGDPTRPVPTAVPDNRPHTLDEAAALIHASVDTLKNDDRQNVRGAAAVLAAYAKEDNGALPAASKDWYGAVSRISGLTDDAKAQEFADEVYATMRTGASLTTSDGQEIFLQAQPTLEPNKSTLKNPLRLFSGGNNEDDQQQTECPSTITCRFEPALFAQNDPTNPAKYGNYDKADRPNDMKVKYIVIHDTEGSYQSAIDWFQDPRSGVAAHYIIRSSDGEVTQMVKTKDVGWQAGNWYMNMHSIGVEHEGFADEGGSWYTETMYRTSAKLVRYLADKYDVPLDREHIVGHEQFHGLTPARAMQMHNDPGPFWEWEHYMDLLHADPIKVERHGSNAVTIAPKFEKNKQDVKSCNPQNICVDLPRQSANFVFLRTAPTNSAPLLTDAGLHPDGAPGTNEIDDWSAVAAYGQSFVVADQHDDWTAIWFGGQKGWFYNPDSRKKTAVPVHKRVVTPKQGSASVPLYGRPVPEPSAYTNGVTPLTPTPLQYTLLAGQSYVAYDKKAINDYYQVLTFDRSAPGDGTVVVGHEKYIPIEYNHRQAFVKASDVDVTQ